MTEAEAKTKWCPIVRTITIPDVDGGSYLVNSQGRSCEVVDGVVKKIEQHCIGSNCMMWRREYKFYNTLGEGADVPEDVPSGYCGLAGKP